MMDIAITAIVATIQGVGVEYKIGLRSRLGGKVNNEGKWESLGNTKLVIIRSGNLGVEMMQIEATVRVMVIEIVFVMVKHP